MSVVAKVLAALVVCGTGGVVVNTENPVKRAVHRATAPRQALPPRPTPPPAAVPCVMPGTSFQGAALPASEPSAFAAVMAGKPGQGWAGGGARPAGVVPVGGGQSTAPAVPEPVLWLQMIAGLATVGGAMRLRAVGNDAGEGELV